MNRYTSFGFENGILGICRLHHEKPNIKTLVTQCSWGFQELAKDVWCKKNQTYPNMTKHTPNMTKHQKFKFPVMLCKALFMGITRKCKQDMIFFMFGFLGFHLIDCNTSIYKGYTVILCLWCSPIIKIIMSETLMLSLIIFFKICFLLYSSHLIKSNFINNNF